MIDQYLHSSNEKELQRLFLGYLQSFEVIQTTIVEGKRESSGETEFHSRMENVYETGIPVKDGKKIMNHHNGPEKVRIVRMSFGSIEKRPKPIDLHQTKDSNDRFESDGQIEEIQRHQTQTIDVESSGVHVVMSQFDRVSLKNAFFEIGRPKVEHDIHQIEKITRIIEDEPNVQVVPGQLMEGETEDDDPEVVEKSQTDDRCPPVGQSTTRIEDEGETAGGWRPSRRRWIEIELFKARFDILSARFTQLFRLTDVVTCRETRSTRRIRGRYWTYLGKWRRDWCCRWRDAVGPRLRLSWSLFVQR